jgi:SAM-dependent methyltransferase
MMSRRALLASAALPVLKAQEKNGNMFGNAEAYERFMGGCSRLIAPLLVEFAAVPDAGRILDIGSGTGSLSFEVARRRPATRVTGIDLSPEYIGYAVSKNPFPDRVAFQRGDAQHLDFPDAAFAAAVSLLVFNFIPDAAKALGEARRVTGPEGRIAAAVWDYGGRMRSLRAFWDAAIDVDSGAEKLDEKNMPLCRSGELARLWTRGGLKNVREQPLDTEVRFSSFADYWDPFLLGQGPAGAYVRTLDQDRLQALRDAVRRRLGRSSDDEPFVVPVRVWAVRGDVPSL